jgi:hypothetical protein
VAYFTGRTSGGLVGTIPAPITHGTAIAKGTVPRQPAEGRIAYDSNYNGRPILRVTGPTTAGDTDRVGTIYPDSMSLSRNDDKFASYVFGEQGGMCVYEIDPVGLQRGAKRAFPTTARAEVGGWSRSNNNIYWCVGYEGTAIKKVDWSNPAAATVAQTWNFTSFTGYAAGDAFTQLSWDDSEDIFASEWSDNDGVAKGYVIMQLSTSSVLRVITQTNSTEGNVTRDGVYMWIRTGIPASDSNIAARWYNISTGAVTASVDTITDGYGGHYDVTAGNGVASHDWNGDGSIHYRTVATAHSAVQVLPNPAFLETYISAGGSNFLNEDGKRCVLISLMVTSINDSLLHSGELVEAALDGTGVRRFGRPYALNGEAHPRGSSYWNFTRANRSVSGKFACFSSNWDNLGGSTDAYMMALR